METRPETLFQRAENNVLILVFKNLQRKRICSLPPKFQLSFLKGYNFLVDQLYPYAGFKLISPYSSLV